MEVGVDKRQIIYLSLHCHHQNDSCIKTGSDERHFNVSLIVRDKVTRRCPQSTTFQEKGEPKRIRTEVPLLTSLTPYRQAKPADTRDSKSHGRTEPRERSMTRTSGGDAEPPTLQSEFGVKEVVVLRQLHWRQLAT